MDACICSTVHRLTKEYDDNRAKDVLPALNSHLADIRSLLAQSKSLTRDVRYRVTLNHQRTMKALSVDVADSAPVDRVCDKFKDDLDGFWAPSEDSVQGELRRRLACVVVFLRSKIDTQGSVPLHIASLFQGQQSYAELRNSGRKYIKIARRLGGLGNIFWLPLDVPPSTYERYLNMDDEDVFKHLDALGPEGAKYGDLVQRLILSQLQDSSLAFSYHNLVVDYRDVIPATDHILLLLHALGGSDIPEILLTSVRFPQRRWNEDGEIEATNPDQLSLPAEICSVLSDDTRFAEAMAAPNIIKHVLEDGTAVLSLQPDLRAFFSQALSPPALEELGSIVLKLLSHVCPPCYEGNTNWTASLKLTIWTVFLQSLRAYKIPPNLRTQVLEATLYFCERDSVPMRHAAVEQAKSLVRKSMPYYLHASVILFQSILYRIDGQYVKAEAQIRDFVWRGPQPATRRDHALHGRLHISQIENKIKCSDNDVPSSIYKWEAEQPLSTLDVEVTFRLQSTAARFFQSVGDFNAAMASLEQFLSLNTANPIRQNSRRLIVGRLADMYCEIEEYTKAADIVKLELDSMDEQGRQRRPFRRLLLALTEANIGLDRLEAAEEVLKEVEGAVPSELEDLFDQQLHMRRLFAAARIAHIANDHKDAVARWRLALQEIENMYTLKAKSGFTAALIYLSMSHAQLVTGDREGGRHSWATGVEILRSERCEFWIPVVPSTWLQRIAREVNELQGWSLRMMMPGGRPDVTWP